MLQLLTRLSVLVGVIGFVSKSAAFSLLGPFAISGGTVWQTPRIGYQLPSPIGGDIGGPMNAAAGEEYRWNSKIVVYAYDAAFFDFFGARGAQEVEKAIKILNDLPSASVLKVDDYPMTAERVHPRASALGLIDLKSLALKLVVEQMGLASPNRWIYTIRNRNLPTPNRFPVNYNFIIRNYEPVTVAGNIVVAQESPYINGRLWDLFNVFDFDTPPWSYTAQFTVDPNDQGRFDPVSSIFDASFGAAVPEFTAGTFYTGLTRDDAGALKFLYQAANKQFEAAIPGSTNNIGFVGGGGGGSPWSIPPNTNIVATNVNGGVVGGLFDPAVRQGVDKVTFVRAQYDSLLGQVLDPVVVSYNETIEVSGVPRSQNVQRLVTVPDILFTAQDLQGADDPGGIASPPAVRSNTSLWNKDASTPNAGPGVILPTATIFFNNVGFITPVTVPGPISSQQILGTLPWYVLGAFDGTTNEPVLFSPGGNLTVFQLEQLRLGR
jgi:hypothetical protein